MEPANPYAPPFARSEPSRRSIWWLPTWIFGGLAVLLSLAMSLVGVLLISEWRQPPKTLREESPIALLIGTIFVLGGSSLACGSIARAWHRRRWRRALPLTVAFLMAWGCGLLLLMGLTAQSIGDR